MRQLFIAALSLFFIVVPNLGQPPECPRIIVNGPAGVWTPGEDIVYHVHVEPTEKDVGLSYLWSVTHAGGEAGMVRGQGTTKIVVPGRYGTVAAAVTVKGLPPGCPDSASESVSYHPPIVAELLKVVTGSVSKIPAAFFNSIRQRLQDEPNAMLFVSITAGKSGTAVAKTKQLKKRLTVVDSSLSGRSKMVVTKGENDEITFWLVPPRAERPI